jgi:hypothetical protein
MNLKKIEFEEFQVYQATPKARIAWWSFRPTNQDLSDVEVDVFRSFSPEEDFGKVGTVKYPQTYFVDEEVNLKDFWRGAYYSISAVIDGRTIVKEAVGLYSSPPSTAKEIVKEIDLTMKFGGHPVFVYLRRKGVRCPDCWDIVLKKVTSSSCPTCFATGYLGGFHTPILTCIHVTSETKTNQPDVTKREAAQTRMKMSRFPEVRPRDILREANAGKLWRIVSIQPVRMHGFLIHQGLIVTRLESSEIEHDLPIPENLDYVITPHWADVIRTDGEKLARDDSSNPIEEKRMWR